MPAVDLQQGTPAGPTQGEPSGQMRGTLLAALRARNATFEEDIDAETACAYEE
jgi:hypothetical protein